MGSARPTPTLTLEEAKALQRELYNGFNDDEFRDKLDELEARVGRACDNYTKEHTALFLTVQNEVLPKYGFPTGEVGVLQMLQASARFNNDEQFRKNRDMLNETLGLSRTVEEEKSRAEEVARQLPREVRVMKLPGGSLRDANKKQLEAATPKEPSDDPSRCLKGHGLKEFKTVNDKVTCDRCSTKQARGVTMSGCRICDFDVCSSCFDPRSSSSSSHTAVDRAEPVAAASPAGIGGGGAAAAAAAAGGYPVLAPTAPEDISTASSDGASMAAAPMVTEHLRWRPPSAFGVGVASNFGGSSSVTALARAAVSSKTTFAAGKASASASAITSISTTRGEERQTSSNPASAVVPTGATGV